MSVIINTKWEIGCTVGTRKDLVGNGGGGQNWQVIGTHGKCFGI